MWKQVAVVVINKNNNINKNLFYNKCRQVHVRNGSDEFAKDHRKIMFVCYLLIILTKNLK